MISTVWGGRDFPITQPYSPATHRGIDIGMPTGMPLYAARAGRVFAVGPGYLAIQVDGTAQRDWYLHIERAWVVGFGTVVQRLQLVAASGAVRVPGGPPPTGPHLHFEVQTGALDIAATSLDPVPVLSGLFGAGGSTIDDMTPEEHEWLRQLVTAVRADTGAAVDEILTVVRASPGGTVDLAGINAKLDAIKAIVDKIDRGE